MIGKTVVALVVVLLALCPCSAQTERSKTVATKAVKQLDRELEQALLKNDIATIDRILADDYVEIDAQGSTRKKVDVIERARSSAAVSRGVMVGPEKSVDDVRILVHGDSVLVVGRTTIRYQFMENQIPSPGTQPSNSANIYQERFIRTYARVARRWQLVAWQTTAIAKR